MRNAATVPELAEDMSVFVMYSPGWPVSFFYITTFYVTVLWIFSVVMHSVLEDNTVKDR